MSMCVVFFNTNYAVLKNQNLLHIFMFFSIKNKEIDTKRKGYQKKFDEQDWYYSLNRYALCRMHAKQIIR